MTVLLLLLIYLIRRYDLWSCGKWLCQFHSPLSFFIFFALTVSRGNNETSDLTFRLSSRPVSLEQREMQHFHI